MKITLTAPDAITPYDKNPRLNDKAVDAVARSIEEFGFRQPVVVDEHGVIIVGHTRWKAARKLGIDRIPVHVAEGLSPEKAKAYRIADNATAALADWDLELLPVELAELKDLGLDLDLLGFDDEELQRLLGLGGNPGQCDPDDIPEPPDDPVTKPGDLWVLGDHRLLCGDSSSEADVDWLLDGNTIQLVNTDPPYNVKVEPRSNNAFVAGKTSFHPVPQGSARAGTKVKATTKSLRAKDRPLDNDNVTDEAFAALLQAWFGNLARVLDAGRAFYIWGGYANIGNYPAALKDAGLRFAQQIIWHKMHPVISRKDFMGDHEWCQPAETEVLTPDGEVPIASLRDGDQVVGYATQYHRLTGRRGGQTVRRATRPYTGDLLGVVVGKRQTWTTPGHIWSARLAPDADRWWCVYLMRRGPWWRVGKSRMINSWGFGLKHRVYTEGGDGAWILSVHRTNAEALVAEQAVAAIYGIPLTVWWRRGEVRARMGDPHALYDRLDLESLNRCAARALADHGRALEYPCVTAERLHEKISRRVPFRVRSANLLPEVMLVPAPTPEGVVWTPVGSVERTPYRGTVHSLGVDPSGHYVADGIVTHNCFYGWREGAAHKYFGPNNVPDVWPIKKVSPQSMVHLTEKPVELAARAIGYSTKPGERVIDLFGGSGSTLIAAEQQGRKAYLMEIDPAYCDVIRERWETFAGKKAECVNAS